MIIFKDFKLNNNVINMESIQWENIDMNNFNIFMRDLTYNNNINLKHQIESFK